MLILTRTDAERLISLSEAIPAVEKAFLDMAAGRAVLFPVIREPVLGGFFGVKAGYLPSAGILGYKGGGFWASNRARGMAAHQSLIALYDPDTGQPLAVIDGNYLTIIRTGAAGAIAARELARPDSSVAAIIGAGAQGEIQLRALAEVLPIRKVHVFDPNRAGAQALADSAESRGIHATIADSVHDAVKHADVIVTATPSFEAVVQREWVRPGTHINAFGADTRGKQELDPALVAHARLVVDYLPQAREIGESQHVFRDGLVETVHAELGEILARTKPGRTSPTEITVFDATGIALQDLAVASVVLNAARSQGLGVSIKLD
jgi:alanine dehydrogenase